MTELIEDVTDTAFWVAVYRARESERKDALFHDPLASSLVGERGQRIASKISRGRYVEWSVVIRTCIIDEYLHELVNRGVDTVINLGCGLDTRPYRLKLPHNLRWIEVDFPKMIQFKEEHLADQATHCRFERVGLDLTDSERRRKFLEKIGAESTNSVVLTEGVVPYLTEEQVEALARDLRSVPSIRHWIIDYYSHRIMRYMNSRSRRKVMRNAPFRFAPQDWFGFFEDSGWKKSAIRYFVEESERRGRAIPMPLWVRALRTIFPVPTDSPYRQFSGFALLEPSSAKPTRAT